MTEHMVGRRAKLWEELMMVRSIWTVKYCRFCTKSLQEISADCPCLYAVFDELRCELDPKTVREGWRGCDLSLPIIPC